jgi:hypothetical protein
MKSDLDRLNDILTAIAKIEERAADRLAFKTMRCSGLGYPPPAGHWRGCPWRLPTGQGPPSRGPMAADCCVAKYPRARILRPQLGQIWMMTQKDLPRLEEQIRRSRAEAPPDPRSSA